MVCSSFTYGWVIALVVQAECSMSVCDGNTATSKRYIAFLNRYVGFDRPHELSVDFCERLRQFETNERTAASLTMEEDGSAVYSASHSPFGDWDPEEFRNKILMRNVESGGDNNVFLSENDVKDFDWVAKGMVSSVKNQGSLGTCYAFAAAGAVEAQMSIHGGQRNAMNVSVEQVIECSSNNLDGNANCGEFGGWPSLVFEYWKKSGFVADSKYPYCAGILDPKTSLPQCFPCMAHNYNKDSCGDHDDFYCNASTTKNQHGLNWCQINDPIGKVKHWNHVNATSIINSLMEDGPLTAIMDARTLQFYRHGIAHPKFCSSTSKNHAVLLVGFGPDYWRVKNSWGNQWGENGFFRLQFGRCGVEDVVTRVEINPF